jgi:mannose-6-phosphate isomerase
LMLNLVCLQPGEALCLPAGELHAYLSGTGVELMANSDNVIRGGLTSKHVDLPELLKILNFQERNAVQQLLPVNQPDGSRIYPCDAREFALSVIAVSSGKSYSRDGNSGIEMLLCTSGNAVLADSGSDQRLDITRGQTVMIAGCTKSYQLSGKAELFRASVPEKLPGKETPEEKS